MARETLESIGGEQPLFPNVQQVLMRCTYVLFAVLGKEHDQFVDGSGSFTQNRQKVECDRIDLEETDIARVENGQQVAATLDAYPDKPFPAKVRTVIPTADRQKATVKVRITILNLEKYDFILPDMGVKVAFLENEQPARRGKSKDKEKGPQAVAFIPKSAVRSDANVSFVLLVRDGKVERDEPIPH